MARLDDGFSSTITFANYPGLAIFEKEITPPGMDGGGEIDTTTMKNSTWRTKSPKKLKTMSDGSASYAYDVDAYTNLIAMINENQLITITFPDGKTIAFWGWLNAFTPQALVEGEQPVADATIMPSNQNASGVETAPVIT